MIDDHDIDVPPSEHLLVVRNDDQPGMIGTVGAVVGAAGVNIDDMAVGAGPDGERALMVMATDRAVPETVAEELRCTDGVRSVSVVA